MGHTCTYYCQGDVHCMPLLAPPQASAESVRWNCERIGLRVIEVRRATEVDVTTWEQHPDNEYWDEDGQHHAGVAPQHAQKHTSPWLVFVRKRLVPSVTALRSTAEGQQPCPGKEPS